MLFRGKFPDYLKRSYESGDLVFPGVIEHRKGPHVFDGFRRRFLRSGSSNTIENAFAVFESMGFPELEISIKVRPK